MAYFSEREVRLARSFIKAIKGNQTNGYLLLAVIAWQRHMAKSHDAFFASLSRYSSVAAGQRLAAKLVTRANLDSKHYRGVLSSLRRWASGTAKTVDQARDFMLAIQMSSWDKKHYGYRPAKDGYWLTRNLPNGTRETIWVPPTPEYDPLAITWAKLTGHTIPKQWFIDGTKTTTRPGTPAPKPRPAPPRQPRSLIHVIPDPDYLRPYAARSFYEERGHLGDPINILSDDARPGTMDS